MIMLMRAWEFTADGVRQDMRYAVRSLRKSPAFTTVAALTLALAIGGTTAIFSLLDATMLRSLPVRQPEQLVVVRAGGLYPVYQAFQSQTDVFDQLCAMGGVNALDVDIQGTTPERTSVSLVSGSYFTTLGVPAALGRTFTDDEDRTPGAHPAAVISDGYWQRRFARDPAILNRIIRINGTAISIVGVAQSGFFGEEVGVAPDLWVPLSMYGQVVPGRNLLESPGTGWLRMIGRVHDGVRVTGPQPVLTRVFQRTLGEVFGPSASDDVRRDIATATVTLEPAATGISSLRTRFGRPLQLLMGGVVVLLVIAFSLASSAFLSVDNLMTVSLQVTSIAYLGVAATCVIITGGIDLSVGSVLALAGVGAALLVKLGVPVPAAMLCGVFIGALCGLVNGICVTRMGLPPFIATLGMMLVARGVALQITGARPVSDLGDAFGALGNGALFRISRIGADGFPNTTFPGIPYPVIIMVVLFVGVSVLLSKTSLGRHIYAVGSNAEAARLSGVNVQGVKLFTYVLSGALAGVTGCVLMSRLVTGQPNEGVMYELDAIASSVIGGTSLAGGIGTIYGAMLGALLMQSLQSGMTLLNFESAYKDMVVGAVLVTAVWLDQVYRTRLK